VAFVGDKIVAHNKNLKDLMKEIDAKKLKKKASIFWCQEKTKVHFFCFSLRNCTRIGY
jgi:hypothetical protein